MEQVGAKTLLASLGLMLVTLLWGLSFAVVKNSLDLVPPVYMMAFRFSIASLALLLVFPKKLSAITKETLKKGFVLGIFLALGYALQTIGVVYTSAGKNAFITTTYVIFVPFIYWFFTKQKPGFFSIIPAFVGLLGIALLSLQDDLSVNKGDILTLLCGISYAFHMVFIALFTKDDDPILLNLVQIFFVTVFSWLLAPFYDGAFPLLAIQDPATIWSMLFLGIFCTMLAFFLQTLCQKFVPPGAASLIMSLEAVFGVFFAWLILGEILSLRMAFGALLVFVAILLSQKKTFSKT